LPHQPDWRGRLSLPSQNVHQGFSHRLTRGTLISNPNRILESVVELGQLIGLINRLAQSVREVLTYPQLPRASVVRLGNATDCLLSDRYGSVVNSISTFHRCRLSPAQ
jgi:hypothetical protein